MALASSPYCRFTSARLAPVPARIKEGGDAPSRRHSRHPSRPRRRRDDWGAGNPVALASSPYCRFTSARLAPAPVRIKVGGDAPSRRHSRHPSRPRQRRDDWGVGNPVALASSPYCRFTSARLAPAPVRIKAGGNAPSRRHSRHPSRPRRRRDDWGVGNPVALASSPYCRFTSARLAPAPSGSKQVGMPPPAVMIKAGGNAPSRRHDQSRWECPLPPSFSAPQSSTPKAWTTGVSGIQWLLQVAPTVVSPQRVLLPPPSGLKKAGTGVSGIQWLLQVAPTVVSPQRVLLQPPSGSK